MCGNNKYITIIIGNEHISKLFIFIDLFTTLLLEILSHILVILL